MQNTAHTQPINLSASSLEGTGVVTREGEDLGKIEELMIDLQQGQVAYAVLSFGGFLGMGDKLFALPWSALHVDTENRNVLLDVSKERLKAAPGFDKNTWPDTADRRWGADIHTYYGVKPYWTS